TFYAHFRDKDALLVSGLDDLEEGLRDAMAAFVKEGQGASERALGSVQALLEHVAAHRWLYRGSVGGRAETLVTRQLRRRLTALARRHYQEMVVSYGWTPPVARGPDRDSVVRCGWPRPVPLEMTAEFVIGAFLGVMWWWLEQDEPLPAERVVELVELLTTPTIDAALGMHPPG